MPRYYQEPTFAVQPVATVCDFPSPGAYTWTVPAQTFQATFEIWGGGGGGAAHCCCDCYRGGRGGSGGAYTTKTIAVTPGNTYSICVGYGGMVDQVGSCTVHWCCFGQNGSTTYINGTNLSNFCATGGCGGNSQCYYTCGCTDDSSSCGYGGDINARGAPGWVGHRTEACSNTITVGGSAGGFSASPRYNTPDHCCPATTCGCAGTFPGGGGQTALSFMCCCCSAGGVGANGLVRIHY